MGQKLPNCSGHLSRMCTKVLLLAGVVLFSTMLTTQGMNVDPLLQCAFSETIDGETDNVAIILYQVIDTECIWKDSGSGANRDFWLMAITHLEILELDPAQHLDLVY